MADCRDKEKSIIPSAWGLQKSSISCIDFFLPWLSEFLILQRTILHFNNIRNLVTIFDEVLKRLLIC